MTKQYFSASEAFYSISKLLLSDCVYESAPRGQSIRELIGYSFKISNPLSCIVTIPERKISRKYLAKEFIWYSGADIYNTDYICKAAPFWKSIVDMKKFPANKEEIGMLNSNYGYYCFNKSILGNISQFDYCLESLVRDSDTRQAIININNTSHKSNPPLKDFPCTLGLQFFIRDNKVHMIVNMRSCDIVLGFCNDVFQFSLIQQLMRSELERKTDISYKLGSICFQVGSIHLYERNFDMIKSIKKQEFDELDKDSIFDAYDLILKDIRVFGKIARDEIEPFVDPIRSDAYNKLIKMAYPELEG